MARQNRLVSTIPSRFLCVLVPLSTVPCWSLQRLPLPGSRWEDIQGPIAEGAEADCLQGSDRPAGQGPDRLAQPGPPGGVKQHLTPGSGRHRTSAALLCLMEGEPGADNDALWPATAPNLMDNLPGLKSGQSGPQTHANGTGCSNGGGSGVGGSSNGGGSAGGIRSRGSRRVGHGRGMWGSVRRVCDRIQRSKPFNTMTVALIIVNTGGCEQS